MLIGIVSSGTFGCFEGNGMQLLFVPAHWAYDEAALFVRFALWPEGVQAKSRWRQRKESLAPKVVLVAYLVVPFLNTMDGGRWNQG